MLLNVLFMETCLFVLVSMVMLLILPSVHHLIALFRLCNIA